MFRDPYFFVPTLIMWGLNGLTFVVAHYIGVLTLDQFRASHQEFADREVEPLLWHVATWNYFLIIPLFAYGISNFGRQWDMAHIWIAQMIGIAVAITLQLYWARTAAPQAHGWNGMISEVGLVHILVLSQLIACFVCLTFFTKDVGWGYPMFLAIILYACIVGATGVLQALLGPAGYPQSVLEHPGTKALLSWKFPVVVICFVLRFVLFRGSL